ncbi:ABC transporter substrate-binding protein [Gordonia sp. NPDC003429]
MLFAKRFSAVAAGVAAILAVSLSACSSDESSSGASSSGNDRITLTVGDQVKQTESLLEASGELKDLPYDITWASFESGPPLLEAASAGKVDIGGTGDVPPVFAQASGAKLKIVAVQARSKPGDFLLVPPGSSVRSIADLKGKKVAFTKGSSSNGLVLALLDQAGLKPADIEQTFLTPTEGLSAFTNGQVDAWAVWNPFAQVAISQHGATVVSDGAGLVTQQAYYLASDASIADQPKRKAINDLIARLSRANQWAVTHENEWIPTYSKLTKLPEPIARATFATSSGGIVPIGPEQIAKQQRLIDLFADAKVIPTHPTAADYFDQQFNGALAGTGATG